MVTFYPHPPFPIIISFKVPSPYSPSPLPLPLLLTSSSMSFPFLSCISSYSVPPGAYSMAIISDFSSTKDE